MALTKKAKDTLKVAMANATVATEIADAIDAGGSGGGGGGAGGTWTAIDSSRSLEIQGGELLYMAGENVTLTIQNPTVDGVSFRVFNTNATGTNLVLTNNSYVPSAPDFPLSGMDSALLVWNADNNGWFVSYSSFPIT